MKMERGLKAVREALRLYLVTDRAWLGERTLMEQVEEAVRAGATFVQLREKDLSPEAFTALGRAVKTVTDRYGVPFVINDAVAVALAVGADGVHIGQADGSVSACRMHIGPDRLLGVSVQTVEEALAAETDGADYLGVGAVFPTATKADAADVSLETLGAICRAVRIPVVAIGGINRDNVLKLDGTGIDGVAVVSALLGAEDISAATREMSRLTERLVAGNAPIGEGVTS